MNRGHWLAALAFALVGLPPAWSWAANLTVDGARKMQTFDGAGVNINVNSWKGGELRPALDLLIDTHGSSIMRVIRDPIDWVKDETPIPALHGRDPAMLQQIYETPAMQDIWGTIGYLNEKGLRGNAVMLNFMGWTPLWLGGSGKFGVGSHIVASQNGAFATMIASLVYYARRVKNLDFNLLAPLNEQDWNCLEGPCLSPDQYTTVLQAIAAELDGMGLTDVRLVGPDCAGSPDGYLAALRGNATVLGRIDHFALHSYVGSASPGPDVAAHNYWLTETAAACGGCDTGSTPSQGEWSFAKDTSNTVLGAIANGISSVLLYDGFDSFYYHHDSFGFWGLVAYDQNSHVYAARKRMFANAQIARFVRPGAARISVVDSIGSLGTTVAFADPSGAVTIVGSNQGTGTLDISGELLGLAGVTSLGLFETNSAFDLAFVGNVPVTGGQFMAQIPADTIFTLSSAAALPDGGNVGTGSTSATSGTGSTSATSGTGNTSATSGTGAGAVPADSSGGCGCRTQRSRRGSTGLAWALAGVSLAFARRRAKRALKPS